MADDANKPSGAESPEPVVVNGTGEDDMSGLRPADIEAVSLNNLNVYLNV